MARDTFYLSMSYGKLPVHHLEPEIIKTWNPVKIFGYGIPHRQAVSRPIWNDPLSDDTLSTMEKTILGAIGKLDEKYRYAVEGRYEIDGHRTCIDVHLEMENEFWKDILGDFFAYAGTPNWFSNLSGIHDLGSILQKYGKRLDGFYVKEREQAA